MLSCAALHGASVAGDTSVSSSASFAYAANGGWINMAGDLTHGVVVGEYFLSGYAWGANVGWIDFGDGTPQNGIRYQFLEPEDHGVNHDGAGNLSGLAYGANIGWISFSWAQPDDPQRPRINLQTGAFSGFAYSANLGWINLGSGFLTTDRMVCTDSDSDGIADEWEREQFGNLTTANATSDFDKDGVLDGDEYRALTDPKNLHHYLKILSQSYNGGLTEATLEFTTNPGRRYEIYTSDDLVMWTRNTVLGTFSADAGATTTRTVSFTNSLQRKFFRVRAVKPLQP